jgi:hypothetical protein
MNNIICTLQRMIDKVCGFLEVQTGIRPTHKVTVRRAVLSGVIERVKCSPAVDSPLAPAISPRWSDKALISQYIITELTEFIIYCIVDQTPRLSHYRRALESP